MTAFVGTYLETADDDPDAGFGCSRRPTRPRASGLAGYEGFWGNVVNVRVESIEATSRTSP